MAEVDAGNQPPVQSTKLQHLIQVAQLVDFAHSFRAQGDVPQAGAVHRLQQNLHSSLGDIQRLPACAAHQGPGVDHHPRGSHPVRQSAGGQHIAVIFRYVLRVG